MSKQHRDFVTYVRNSVAIKALVAFSHDVYTPATQTEAAKTVEHLTLVYLDPASATDSIQTGEQLRGSIKTEFSVPPLSDGLVNGWDDGCRECGGGPCRLDSASSGAVSGSAGNTNLSSPALSSDEIAAHLFEQIKNGDDLTVPDGANLGTFIKVLSDIVRALKTTNNNLETQVEELGASLKDADAAKTEVEAELVEAKAKVAELTPKPIDAGVGQPAPTE